MKSFRLMAVLLVSVGLLVGVARYQGHAQSSPTTNWSCAEWQQGFTGMMGNGGMMNGWNAGDMMDGWNAGDMMDGWNAGGAMWGMMGNGGMMGAYTTAQTKPITLADARESLNGYAAGCGANVTVAGMQSFANDYYARLVDGSGANLMEILVDRYTGAIYPEPGPAMMWNTQSGMYVASGTAEYDLTAARTAATTFLAGYVPGMKVLGGQSFPGYFTFTYGDDHIQGMLSVNAATGAIWVHSWLGPALGGHESEHN